MNTLIQRSRRALAKSVEEPSQRLALASFAIYGFGLASLSGSDVLITKFFSSEVVAGWAEIRSLVGLASIACLVGLDQVFMRSPRSSERLLRLLAVQVPLMSVAIGLIVWAVGYMQSATLATLLIAAAATSLALSQYFRSHRFLMQSQVAQQLWKVLVFVAFTAMAFTGLRLDVDLLVTSLVLVTAFVSILMVLRHPPRRLAVQEPEPAPALYAIGVRFMVTSLFLASAIYAEQLLVNGIGTADEGAIYFAHATYFFFPASAVNGYLGFLIGPWLRDNHDRFVRLVRTRLWLIILAAATYAAMMNLVGWSAWHIIGPSVGAVDPLLQGILLVSCLCTTLYTLPSGYNGIFGAPREHDRLILTQVAAFAISVATFIVLYYRMDMALVHAVAMASVLNWGLRTGLGFWITYLISARRSASAIG